MTFKPNICHGYNNDDVFAKYLNVIEFQKLCDFRWCCIIHNNTKKIPLNLIWKYIVCRWKLIESVLFDRFYIICAPNVLLTQVNSTQLINSINRWWYKIDIDDWKSFDLSDSIEINAHEMNVLCVSVLISLSVLQYAIVWREKNFIASFYYVFMKVQLFHSFIPLKAENVWCDKAKIKHNTFEIINSTERAHRIDWWTMQRKTPDVSMKDVCVHSSDDFCLCLQVERLNITKMICILCATSMVKLQCVQRVPIIIYWRTFCCWVFFSCVCAVSTFFSFYLNFFFHHSAEQPLAHFSLLLQL